MALQPAYGIIQALGGVNAVMGATGASRTRVYSWTWPKERGGTGGTIPQKHHVPLLDFARKIDKPLTAADFLPLPLTQAAA